MIKEYINKLILKWLKKNPSLLYSDSFFFKSFIPITVLSSKRYVTFELDEDGEPALYSEADDPEYLSDGWHTFNELYKYRLLYNAAWFNELAKLPGNPYNVHKSHRHHSGELCFYGDWFIVMADLPTGQISNHYENKDWDLFNIPEKEIADEWDNHTPQQAAERIENYLKSVK